MPESGMLVVAGADAEEVRRRARIDRGKNQQSRISTITDVSGQVPAEGENMRPSCAPT